MPPQFTPPEDLASAERDISQVFKRWIDAHKIDILRTTLRHEASYLAQSAVRSANAVFDYVQANYQVIKGGMDKEDERKLFVPSIAADLVETQLTTAKAATIVFWHAVLDATALALCIFVAAHFPERWDEVGSRRDSDESVESWRERKLKHVHQMSMPKKVKRLLRLLEPKDWEDYTLDKHRIAQLHEVRRRVVHVTGIDAAKDLTDDDFRYLNDTTRYLIYDVVHTFGVLIDPVQAYVGKVQG